MQDKICAIPLAQHQELLRLVRQELKQKQMFYHKNHNPDLREQWAQNISLLQKCLETLQK